MQELPLDFTLTLKGYNGFDIQPLSGCFFHALSQRIQRMELGFQLEFAASVFQSHSGIMLNMIQIRFSNGIRRPPPLGKK